MSYRVTDIAQIGKPWANDASIAGWWLVIEDTNTGEVFNLDVSVPATHEFGIGEEFDVSWNKEGKNYTPSYGAFAGTTFYKGSIPSIPLPRRGGGGGRPASTQNRPQSAPRPGGAPGAAPRVASPAQAAPARPRPTVTQRLGTLEKLIGRGLTAARGVVLANNDSLGASPTPDALMQTAVSIAMHLIIAVDRGDVQPDPTAAQIEAARKAAEAAAAEAARRAQEEADRLAREAQQAGGYEPGAVAPYGTDDGEVPF